jgi:uracil-DNA glycosylase
MTTWNDLDWWESETAEELSNRFSDEVTCPPKNQIYRALDLTPLDQVKVVILGQDPYPTPGYANGLAFSVNPSVRLLPHSLRNIFKEYRSDLHLPIPRRS